MKKPAKSAPAARKPAGRDSVTPQAVGAFEAAALMGVHFTVPRRQHDKGRLSAHLIQTSPNVDDLERMTAIYDSAECDANYREYEEMVAARGGKTERRPRGWLHLRPDVVARLKAVKTPIAFEDAISIAEAAEVLGVHHTLVPRMLREGKVVGRVLWSPRANGGRTWIVSRKSCLQNVKEIKALESAGKKRGLLRKFKKPK